MYKAVLIDCSRCPAARVENRFPGKFLVNALADTIRTSRAAPWAKGTDLRGHEMLRFFVGSPYEQAIAIVWVEAGADYDEAFQQAIAYGKEHPGFPEIIEPNDVRRFLWALENDDDLTVSLFLRGNTKIRSDWFTEVNGVRCLADSQGFAVMADANGAARAARAAQMQALALAYENALFDIANDISVAAKSPEPRAETTLSEVSCFMAAHYFGHPALPNTRELREFYALLSNKQKISEQFHEAVSQVERLAQVVRERRRDHERTERLALLDTKAAQDAERNERERVRTRRVNVVNALVAFASLVVAAAGLTQLTPESLNKWWAAWHGTPPAASAVASPADSAPPAPEPSRSVVGKPNPPGKRRS